MNNEDRTFNVERGRQRVRAAIVLILLTALCSAIYIPGVLEGETKSMVIGGLLNAVGVAMVFFFKKVED